MKGYSKPKKVSYKHYNYSVLYPDANGKRKRKYFEKLQDAQLFYERGNIQTANAGIAVAGLPEEDKRAYLDAQKLLKPFEISVLDAIREYVDARERLTPYKKTLPDCIKHFEKWNTIKEESTTLFKAYGQYMDDLEAQNKGIRRINEQRSRLSRFVNDIGAGYIVGLITPAQCNKWLNSLKVIEQTKTDEGADTNGQAKKVFTKVNISAQTKKGYRSSLSAFFNYCLMAGYIKVNPIDKVPTPTTISEEITFYKVAEARKMLNASAELSDIRIYLAIGLFAGLRSSEILRLDYSDIDLSAGTILLPAKNTKTKQRRVVLINDTLKAWLAPYTLEIVKGGMIIQKNFRKRIEAFREDNGIDWIDNGLRHSFGTYFYALTADANATAKQMGNRPEVMEHHYANKRITPKDAEAYFNILPDNMKITPISKILKTKIA